ncbi:MAG: PstS family phosphate ABC transporter substrate-binding protein [Cyanobacteria bacterium P01_A01_bin.45]
MSKKNETSVLVATLLITLGLVIGVYWWLAKSSGIKLGSINNNQTQTATQTNNLNSVNKIGIKNFSEIKNVPSGLFSYGGSSTWAPIRKLTKEPIQRAFPQFEMRYTNPTNSSPGSGAGIKMLLSDELAFSESSRSLKDKEHQKAKSQEFSLKQIPVAIDGIAIAVHPELDIPGLTIDQLKDIYTGKITNWNQVGGASVPVVAYSKKTEGGTVEFFIKNVLQKESFSQKVQPIQTTTEALRKVARNKGGIYYASAPEVVEQCGVKSLPIGKTSDELVSPYQEPFVPLSKCPQQRNKLNVTAFRSGKYPMTRRLFVIVKQNQQLDQEAGEAYANLLLTEEGQQLISKAGFVRIR